MVSNYLFDVRYLTRIRECHVKMNIMSCLICYVFIFSYPSRGRGKVCVHTTLPRPRPHLWIGFIFVFIFSYIIYDDVLSFQDSFSCQGKKRKKFSRFILKF